MEVRGCGGGQWPDGVAGAGGQRGGGAGLTVGWAHLLGEERLGVQAPPQLPAASPTGALHQHRVHPEEARGREGGALPGADRHLQAERKWGVHGALAFSQLPDQGVQGRTAASAPPTATPAQAWRPGPQSSAASAAAGSWGLLARLFHPRRRLGSALLGQSGGTGTAVDFSFPPKRVDHRFSLKTQVRRPPLKVLTMDVIF